MTKSPKYDPQRNEVYAWEHNFSGSAYGDMGTKRFYALLKKVCDKYKVDRPKCGQIPRSWVGQYYAVCDIEQKALWFDPQCCTPQILLHELAHWVIDEYGYNGTAYHNQLWLGLYLRLMHDFKVMPMDASVPSAAAAGLKFVDPKKCSPRVARLLIEQAQASNRPE